MSKTTGLISVALVIVALGCREATRPERDDRVLLSARSMADVEKIFTAGMSTNEIVSRVGLPDVHDLTAGYETWGYKVTPFTWDAADDYDVIGVVLTITNGALVGWGGFYAPKEAFAANSETSRDLHTRTNIQIELNFYIVHDVPIPSAKVLNTPQFPNLGYIAAMPDFAIGHVGEISLRETESSGGGSPQKLWEIYFALNGDAVEGFSRLTESSHGKRVAILVGEEIISAPVIRHPIMNGIFTITCDDFSKFEAIAQHLGFFDNAGK
jgi:hypothetical protein